MTAASGVAGIETSAVAALAKLGQVLPPRLRERVRALQETTVQLAAGPVLPAVDPTVLTMLQQHAGVPKRSGFPTPTTPAGSVRAVWSRTRS